MLTDNRPGFILAWDMVRWKSAATSFSIALKKFLIFYFPFLRHCPSGPILSPTGEAAMKIISGIKQLEEYGIVPLTGESDAHMYRILCDVTRRGKPILERTLGVQIKYANPWNAGTKEFPHIGSFLLPFEFVPPLAVFCLLSDTDVTEVWLLKNGTAIGLGVADVDQREETRLFHEKNLTKIFYSRPSDRNVHQMTGRVT